MIAYLWSRLEFAPGDYYWFASHFGIYLFGVAIGVWVAKEQAKRCSRSKT